MKIPTPAEVDPELQKLEAARNELGMQISSVTTEARNLRSKTSLSPGTAAANRVREILGEPLVPDRSPDIVLLAELLTKLDALNKAYDILDRRIQDRKRLASKKVCEFVKPEHSRLVKQFANCIIQMHAAHDEYIRFCDRVTDTGASVEPLQPVWPHVLGNPRDSSSGYHYALQDFVDAGHLAKKDVPEAVR